MQRIDETVTSADGTEIGFRSVGEGPGLLLVQGSMGTIENFTQLAQELSDSFTVHLAERRGRGRSPKPFTDDHSITKDVEDVAALLRATDASYLFGLSSGGVIALQAALTLPAVRKVAVYEPALVFDPARTTAAQRFAGEMAKGDIARALVTAMKASEMGPSFLARTPTWLLVALTRTLLRREDATAARNGGPRYWHELAPTLQYDFAIIQEMSPRWRTFQDIAIPVLLLGGSRSPAYLTAALDALEQILPRSERVELDGLDHGAAWNHHKQQNPRGRPARVAQALRHFFSGA